VGPSRTSNHRAVSDVVGTILLLALTVTLFSSIFFFVSTFPTPPPQPSNQFSAYLTYTVSGTTTKIVGVTILHLAGPAVPGSSLIYLYSSAQPTRFTSPFTVASGTNNSANWNLGQNWYLNLTTYGLTVPDNITISLVTSTELLFRTTLPGSTRTSRRRSPPPGRSLRSRTSARRSRRTSRSRTTTSTPTRSTSTSPCSPERPGPPSSR